MLFLVFVIGKFHDYLRLVMK